MALGGSVFRYSANRGPLLACHSEVAEKGGGDGGPPPPPSSVKQPLGSNRTTSTAHAAERCDAFTTRKALRELHRGPKNTRSNFHPSSIDALHRDKRQESAQALVDQRQNIVLGHPIDQKSDSSRQSETTHQENHHR